MAILPHGSNGYTAKLSAGQSITLLCQNQIADDNVIVQGPDAVQKYLHNICLIKTGSRVIFMAFEIINTTSSAYTSVSQVISALSSYVTGKDNVHKILACGRAYEYYDSNYYCYPTNAIYLNSSNNLYVDYSYSTGISCSTSELSLNYDKVQTL